jgi:YfiH family protein
VSQGPYSELNLADHVGDDPSAVTENRRRLGVGPVTWMGQVHGNEVRVLTGRPTDYVPGVDALVTTRSDCWLAVLVADCAPILLADATARVVAAVHAGRRGLAAGVVAAAVAAMTELGARPERIAALVGPAIGACCYPLPAELAAQVVVSVPQAAARTREGQPAIDLRAGLAAQLADLGIRDPVISGVCTAETPTLYSHRRDGVTGRFAGLIRLMPG